MATYRVERLSRDGGEAVRPWQGRAIDKEAAIAAACASGRYLAGHVAVIPALTTRQRLLIVGVFVAGGVSSLAGLFGYIHVQGMMERSQALQARGAEARSANQAAHASLPPRLDHDPYGYEASYDKFDDYTSIRFHPNGSSGRFGYRLIVRGKSEIPSEWPDAVHFVIRAEENRPSDLEVLVDGERRNYPPYLESGGETHHYKIPLADAVWLWQAKNVEMRIGFRPFAFSSADQTDLGVWLSLIHPGEGAEPDAFPAPAHAEPFYVAPITPLWKTILPSRPVTLPSHVKCEYDKFTDSTSVSCKISGFRDLDLSAYFSGDTIPKEPPESIYVQVEGNHSRSAVFAVLCDGNRKLYKVPDAAQGSGLYVIPLEDAASWWTAKKVEMRCGSEETGFPPESQRRLGEFLSALHP